jgi:hypothetical protein
VSLWDIRPRSTANLANRQQPHVRLNPPRNRTLINPNTTSPKCSQKRILSLKSEGYFEILFIKDIVVVNKDQQLTERLTNPLYSRRYQA